jgi:Tol biopolymer transport system component
MADHTDHAASRKQPSPWRAVLLLVAGIAVGASGLAVWNAGRGERNQVDRVSIVSSERIETTAPILLSPDGRSIAYVTSAANGDGATTPRIVTRRLDSFAETLVSGEISVIRPLTSNLTQTMTYSPDGRWIAFIGPLSRGSVERRLYKSAADGSGQPIPLADLPANVLSILWVDDETILGAARVPPSILEFPARGGEPAAPVILESGDLVVNYIRPTSVLPGGRYVLVAADSYGDKGWQVNVALLDRQAGALRFLIQGDNPIWSPTGHILLSRIEQLLAVGFDPGRRRLVGGAVPIEAGLRPNDKWSDGWFDVSPDGTLVYFPGGLEAFQRRVALVDRNGRVEPWSEEKRVFFLGAGSAISPDGRWIVVNQVNWERGIEETWISDFETPRLRPLAAVPGMDCAGSRAWSHDSRMLAYSCNARGEASVFLKPADGSGEARVLFSIRSPETAYPTSFSGDDAILLMDRRTSDGYRVDALRLGENPEPVPLFSGTFSTRSAAYSPDGRWIAYASDESGSHQVYVRSISPDLVLGPPRMVSSKGGERPVWSPSQDGDGFGLVYQSGADLMEVRIVTEPTLRISKPQKVHDLTELRADGISPTTDGRFVFAQHSEEEENPHQINLVFNIFEELGQRAPTD